jgi:hypothetical protein
VVSQGIDNVALGNHSRDFSAFDNRKRTDALLAKPSHRFKQGRVGSDRFDRATLVPEYYRDGHRSPFRDSPPAGLIVPLWAAKWKSMPQPDPIPNPRQSAKQRFWRIFRLLVLLSLVVAVMAVFLVTRGEGEIHASLIIATGLGVGLTMLVGTGLMTLVFISNSSGHDEEAAKSSAEESKEE